MRTAINVPMSQRRKILPQAIEIVQPLEIAVWIYGNGIEIDIRR